MTNLALNNREIVAPCADGIELVDRFERVSEADIYFFSLVFASIYPFMFFVGSSPFRLSDVSKKSHTMIEILMFMGEVTHVSSSLPEN